MGCYKSLIRAGATTQSHGSGCNQSLQFRPVPLSTSGTYRSVRLSIREPPAIGRFCQKSTVGGRLREKSIVDSRLREKSIAGGRLSEKKGRRRRGKEETKKRGEEERIPSALTSSSPTCRPRSCVVAARGLRVLFIPCGEKDRGD
ncbi:hypothetical protein BHE74_00021335, partial [Ensete ventricosum]